MTPPHVLEQTAIPFTQLCRENLVYVIFQVKKAKFLDATVSYLWTSY